MARVITWLTHKWIPCWNFTETDAAYLARLTPGVDIRICWSENDFLRELPTAAAALVWRFEQAYFAQAPNLRHIATPAAGKDYFHIDPPPRVTVSYGTFHGPLMAETVVGMALAHCRGIIETRRLSGETWPRAEVGRTMRSLRGARVTVLGLGHIGEWIARLLKPFGVTLTGVRRTAPDQRPPFFDEKDQIIPLSGLDAVLPTTDHLILCLPRSPETNHIINASRLAGLPGHAALYNVGRGNAVDEAALAAALRAGKLAGAYLDVFETEPLPMDSPLRGCPNAFLMPHVSAVSPDYMRLFCDEVSTRLPGNHA
ncbi:MAG: NAD(P)-dependent oxidoreductase [Lentisphaeria bacterium]|nr:NAD(P)-dependent oxidoreductase [Lentisphaeria bacterium]